MFTALARLADRWRWTVVIVALVVGVVAGVLGSPVAGVLSTGGFNDPNAGSSVTRDRAAAASGLDTTSIVVLLSIPDGVGAASSQAAVAHVDSILHAEPDVGMVVDVYGSHDRSLASNAGTSTYVIGYWRALPESEESAAAKRLQTAFASTPSVQLGGITIAQNDVQTQVSADLAHAEEIAFPILFVLLIIVFRGVIAALLPLMVGGLTIITSLLGLRAVNSFDPLSIFALNLVTGLGLGLGIDYSLLVLSRHREETARGASTADALRRTMNTAGRTVFFSSLTVAAALASLIVFPEKFLYSMAIGGVIAVVTGSVIALTVLPAVLALLGARVDRLALRRRHAPSAADSGAWYRLASFVMRRPLAVALVAGGLLVVMGLPFLRVQFTSVDASVLPTSYVSRQVSDALGRDFPPAHQSPVNIVVSAAADGAAAVQTFALQVARVGGVAAVTPPRLLGTDAWEIDAALSGPPLSAQSRDAATAMRALAVPFAVVVGGQTATFVDLQANLAHHLPMALAIVAIATLVVLFAATGSVVLPIKALFMNLLSLSATFGILVIIFQDGRFTGLLGYTSQGALESTQPILLFAIAFGLSTDYGVFLLTRIKEAHDAGAANREAVSLGLQRTGRIITAAAALFCVAIGSFATSQIIFIKELGIGTAAAVLVDASLVRAFLVPALMALLGDWNWWAPRPLRQLHHRLHLDQMEGAAQNR